MCLVVLAWVASARAHSLVYSADSACPNRAHFLAEVDRRVSTTAAPIQNLRLVLELAPENGSFAGILTATDGEGRTATRRIDAPNCADVVAALALVSALLLEHGVPEPNPESDPSFGDSKSKAAAPDALPVFTRQENAVDRGPEEPLAAHEATMRWQLGSEAWASTAISPGAFMGARLGAGLHSSWGAYQLLASYGRGEAVQGSMGRARFQLFALRLRACPVDAHSGPGLGARLCVFGEAGSLVGWGDKSSGLSSTETRSVPWGAVGPEIQGRWKFGNDWELSAGGAFETVLRRERFALNVTDGEPDMLFRLPQFGWSAGLGLEYWLE